MPRARYNISVAEKAGKLFVDVYGRDSFSDGMVREGAVETEEQPPASSQTLEDMILIGNSRCVSRGPFRSLQANASGLTSAQAVPAWYGAAASWSDDVTVGKSGHVYWSTSLVNSLITTTTNTTLSTFNPVLGAFAIDLATYGSSFVLGKPFTHFGILCFPCSLTSLDTTGNVYSSDHNVSGPVIGAVWPGAPSNLTATTAAVVAGSREITSLGQTPASFGGFVRLTDNALSTNIYIGRITGSSGANKIYVNPAPTTSFTAGSNGALSNVLGNAYTKYQTNGIHASLSNGACLGARAAASFQNRIVMGNVFWADTWAVGGVNVGTFKKNRLCWTILPNEKPTRGAYSAGVADGLVQFMFPESIEAKNYIDIQDVGDIVGLAPMGENQLLVLGTVACARLTGTLTTQTATTGGITWDVRVIQGSVGCTGAGTIQITTRGILFASFDGIYLYNGTTMANISKSRIPEATFIATNNYSTSGLFPFDHYGIMSADAADAASGYLWVCNLDGYRWTRWKTNDSNLVYSTWYDNATSRRYYMNGRGNNTNPTDILGDLSLLIPSTDSTVQRPDYRNSGGVDINPNIVTKTYDFYTPSRLKRWRYVALTVHLSRSSVGSTEPVMTISLTNSLDYQTGAAVPAQVLGTLTGDTPNNPVQNVRFVVDDITLAKYSTGCYLTLSVSGNLGRFEIHDVSLGGFFAAVGNTMVG